MRCVQWCVLSPPSPLSSSLPVQPTWHPYIQHNGHLLEVSVSYPPTLWPWSGYLAVSLSVTREGQSFTGEAQGHITLTISSPTVSHTLTHSNNHTLPSHTPHTPLMCVISHTPHSPNVSHTLTTAHSPNVCHLTHIWSVGCAVMCEYIYNTPTHCVFA